MAPNKAIARSVVVDPWPSGGIELSLEATPEECHRLAVRFALLSLDRLVGQARLERCGEGVIRLRGRLQAEVVQACVISLEDVRSTVDEAFECRFTRPGAAAPAPDLAWDQDIEPLAGTELDVGEIFAQQLALALDPYPRAPDAYALVSRELGPHIAFGDAEPEGALALRVDEAEGAARTAPPKRGRG